MCCDCAIKNAGVRLHSSDIFCVKSDGEVILRVFKPTGGDPPDEPLWLAVHRSEYACIR